MAALKDGGGWCFAHSPKTRGARSRARAKGGQANRRQALPPVPATAAAAGFEIGRIERKGDVARTLVRLARAIAKGEVDPRTGRLVADALRAASAAAGDATGLADDEGAPIGARELEAHELDYVIEHGYLPPDVVDVGPAKWWVAGAVWQRPPAIEAPAADDPDAR